jgi:hypothetical protein
MTSAAKRQAAADVAAAHRARTIARYQQSADDAADAAGVVVAALRLQDALKPILPTGGGFLVGDRADLAAEVVVAELTRCGWLAVRQGVLDLEAGS